MNIQQLLRIDRIYNDSMYLLNKEHYTNKFVFDISGSTNNIYKVQIYFPSKMIFCDCPDAKGICKKHKLLCKHCCFILIKVLKLKDYEQYFKSLILSDNELEYIKTSFNNLDLDNNNSFINDNYIKRFSEIDLNRNSSIVLKDNYEKICVICYDILEDITNLTKNKQCKRCYKIIHKNCLQKWIDMGKKTCPYCRNYIDINDNNNYKNLFS